MKFYYDKKLILIIYTPRGSENFTFHFHLRTSVYLIAALPNLLVHNPLLLPHFGDLFEVRFAQLPLVFGHFAFALRIALRHGALRRLSALPPVHHVVDLLLDVPVQSVYVELLSRIERLLGFLRRHRLIRLTRRFAPLALLYVRANFLQKLA